MNSIAYKKATMIQICFYYLIEIKLFSRVE